MVDTKIDIRINVVGTDDVLKAASAMREFNTALREYSKLSKISTPQIDSTFTEWLNKMTGNLKAIKDEAAAVGLDLSEAFEVKNMSMAVNIAKMFGISISSAIGIMSRFRTATQENTGTFIDAFKKMPDVMKDMSGVLNTTKNEFDAIVTAVSASRGIEVGTDKWSKAMEKVGSIFKVAENQQDAFIGKSEVLRATITNTLDSISDKKLKDIFDIRGRGSTAKIKDLRDELQGISDIIFTKGLTNKQFVIDISSGALGDVAENLKKMDAEAASLGTSISTTAKYMLDFADASDSVKIEKFTEMPNVLRSAFNVLDIGVEDFTKMLSIVSGTRGLHYGTTELGNVTESWVKKLWGAEGATVAIADKIGILRAMFTGDIDLIKPETLQRAFDISGDNIDEKVERQREKLRRVYEGAMWTGMSNRKFDFELSMGDVTNVASQLRGISAEGQKLDLVWKGLVHSSRLEGDALKELSALTGKSIPQIQKFGKTMDDLNKSQFKTSYQMQQVRKNLGVVGLGFRDITMQLYWASLGFLFLSMTMLRAEQAEVRIAQRSYSLANAMYNIGRASKSVKEALIEYGQGSEEAGEAQVRLEQAEAQLVLQQKQLALATKQEAIQNMQQLFSQIPLYVNTIWLLWTGYANLAAGIATKSAVTMRDAAATNIATGADTANTAAKTVNATQTKLSTVLTEGKAAANVTEATTNAAGTVVEKAANVGRLASIKGLIAQTSATIGLAKAKAILVNVGIPVIGILAAMAASFAVTAIAEREAAEETRKMTAGAEKQSTRWNYLADGIDVFSMKLRVLRIAINEVTGEMVRLNEVGEVIGTVPKTYTIPETAIAQFPRYTPESSNVYKVPNAILEGNAIPTGTTTVNSTVVFNNPVVRDESDLYKLVNEFTTVTNDTFQGIGGGGLQRL